MRGKGEGAVFRVPADRTKPLVYWQGTVELPARDGKRRRVTIRRKVKSDLLTEMDNLKDQLRKRGDLPTKNTTVEQWFTYWYEQIASKEVRPKTLDGYKAVVFNHVIPTIGKVKLDKLNAVHMRKVQDHFTVDLGLSSTYALLAHRVMSASFKVAIREGRIGRNPADLINAPRKSTAHQEAFDVAEAVKVLEHVASDEELGARWATALLTGARRGEVLGLEYDRVSDVLDLSWQLQRLTVTETAGKPKVPADFEYRHLVGGLYLTRPKSTAGWRIIPLVDPLRSILERHIAATGPNPYGLVFTLNAQPIDPDRDSKNWKTVLAETGIEKDVVLHGLRHTAVDLLFLAGVPEDIIGDIVGHSTRAVTRGYKSRGSINRARLDDAMERFSALFTTPVDGRSSTPGELSR